MRVMNQAPYAESSPKLSNITRNMDHSCKLFYKKVRGWDSYSIHSPPFPSPNLEVTCNATHHFTS